MSSSLLAKLLPTTAIRARKSSTFSRVLEYTVEGRAPVTLRAGEVLFVPYGAIHSARNVGAGSAVELATYVVEKGKPLLVPAE